VPWNPCKVRFDKRIRCRFRDNGDSELNRLHYTRRIGPVRFHCKVNKPYEQKAGPDDELEIGQLQRVLTLRFPSLSYRSKTWFDMRCCLTRLHVLEPAYPCNALDRCRNDGRTLRPDCLYILACPGKLRNATLFLARPRIALSYGQSG